MNTFHDAMSYRKHARNSLDRQEGARSATPPPGEKSVQNWRAMLHDRRLSDSTIEHFNIGPAGNSWKYLVHPDISERRHKHFDSQATPKYWWNPKKPAVGTFYNPRGVLHENVQNHHGELWIAAGEPDVWALFEAGIPNATCLLQGESSRIPEWVLPALQDLGVTHVHIAPDRDPAGEVFGRKINALFQDTEISILTHELPYPMGSKADIGQFLLDRGPERLREALLSLPSLSLPPVQHAHRPTALKSETDLLYQRWCVDVVEKEAVWRWDISAPNGYYFSQKNILCRFHDDQKPSAKWNYMTHGVHCYVCGDHNTHQVAEELGVQPWEEYRAESIRQAKEGQPAPARAAQLGGEISASDSWPYGVNDHGQMVLRKFGEKNDEITSTPIADFQIAITEEVVTEENQRLFTLKGKSIHNDLIVTTIPAEDMAETRKVKAAISAAADPRSVIYPRMDPHLIPAIRKLSPPPHITRVYHRTGWVEDTFLCPGREPPDTRIQIPEKLAYQINPEASLDEGIRALEFLIQSVGPANWLPILVTFLQAPMAHRAGWRNERYAAVLLAPSGKFKTSVAQLAQSIFGPSFAHNDNLLIKWGEGATRLSVMTYAASASDMPLLIDNYKPNTGDGDKGFRNLIHNVLEGSDRDRLDRSADLQKSRRVDCWPIITAEDIPDSDPATTARLLVCQYADLPENASELLTAAQQRSEHLCAVGEQWLAYLESKEGAALVKDAAKQLPGYREQYIRQLHDHHTYPVNASRIATNVATNRITWDVLCLHPLLGPVFQQFGADYELGQGRVISFLATATTEARPAEHFVGALRELLNSGKYRLAQIGEQVRDPDRTLGYADGDGGAYLYPKLTRAAVEQLIGKDTLGHVSPGTLYQQLDDRHLVASKDKTGHLKTTRVGGGESQKYLHLTKEAISGQD